MATSSGRTADEPQTPVTQVLRQGVPTATPAIMMPGRKTLPPEGVRYVRALLAALGAEATCRALGLTAAELEAATVLGTTASLEAVSAALRAYERRARK